MACRSTCQSAVSVQYSQAAQAGAFYILHLRLYRSSDDLGSFTTRYTSRELKLCVASTGVVCVVVGGAGAAALQAGIRWTEAAAWAQGTTTGSLAHGRYNHVHERIRGKRGTQARLAGQKRTACALELGARWLCLHIWRLHSACSPAHLLKNVKPPPAPPAHLAESKATASGICSNLSTRKWKAARCSVCCTVRPSRLAWHP